MSQDLPQSIGEALRTWQSANVAQHLAETLSAFAKEPSLDKAVGFRAALETAGALQHAGRHQAPKRNTALGFLDASHTDSAVHACLYKRVLLEEQKCVPFFLPVARAEEATVLRNDAANCFVPQTRAR